MLVIISKVAVVFIYIGIGFAANKLKVLPQESTKYFIDLIMDITCPCLVITAVLGQELDSRMYENTIMTFVLMTLIFAVLTVVTTIIADRVFSSLDQQDRNVLGVSMAGCNSGFMGMPVAKAVFGPEVFYYIVIQTISNNLYLFVMSGFQFHHRERVAGASRSFKDLLRPFASISTISTIASIVMLFIGIRLPDYLMDLLTPIGDITIPLSMMLVGIRLGASDFRKIVADRNLIVAALFKLVLLPALVMLAMIPLHVDPLVKLTCVLSISFPSAVIGVAMAAKENKNSQLIAEAVATTTLLSMVTLPVWIVILTRVYL